MPWRELQGHAATALVLCLLDLPAIQLACLSCSAPPPNPGSRFNLLREESEGYAKLATLLNQQAGGALTPATTPAVVSSLPLFFAQGTATKMVAWAVLMQLCCRLAVSCAGLQQSTNLLLLEIEMPALPPYLLLPRTLIHPGDLPHLPPASWRR